MRNAYAPMLWCVLGHGSLVGSGAVGRVFLAGSVQQATTTTRRDYKKAGEGGVVRATLGGVP